MTKVKVHIWYDTAGRILGVGRPSASARAGVHALPIAGKNQSILETEVEEGITKTLAQTHKVDVVNKVLHNLK